jgi:tRNA dimethylallyltransferase
MAAMIEFDRPRVVVLTGPTGVGKSRLAIELAETFGGEIISADSMQVYRYMDIGTAKPTHADQIRVPHHLIDLVTPDEPFHAGLYRTLGRQTVDRLVHEGKHVWVVGGAGLYIKTLIQGLFTSPKIDPSVRERLHEEAQEKGGSTLYQRLQEVDPETGSRLHRHDLYRIIRALEVFESTGAPISFFHKQHSFGERPYLTLKIGLETDREALYRRIEERVDQMVERGLLREVKGLMEMGYGPQLKPMQSMGYKQMAQFVSGETGWEETVSQIKRETRRYAKRQWTWFKADPEIRWRDESKDRESMFREIESFLGEEGVKCQ